MDLEVQTPLLRQAADVVDDAAAALASGGSGGLLDCPLADDSLGATAVAREVVQAAARRVPQAAEAASLLARLTADVAEKLRVAATAFESAESSAIRPPR